MVRKCEMRADLEISANEYGALDDMANLMRLGAVNWTVVAGLSSLMGVACGSTETQGPISTDSSSSSSSTSGVTTSAGTTSSVTSTGATSTTGSTTSATTSSGASGTTSSGGTTSSTNTSGGSATTSSAATTSGASGASTSAGGDSSAPSSDSGETTGGDTSDGPVGSIDGYNPDFKEFVGEDCELPEPMLLSSPSHSLPDPFLMSDGMRMSSVSEWACQRAWLKKQVEAFVHGEKPPTPDTVTGSVTNNSINVHVEHGGASADFSFMYSRPGGASGAVPAMFQADGSGVPSSFLSGEGVAAINYSHSAAEGAFNKIYSGADVTIQIKWAWAVSRAIDVLVSERDAGRNDFIDPTALGTTGCSYAGKSAFTVGAFDERIALGIPVESGSGGLGSYRVLADKDLGPNGGEDPEQVSEACGKDWLTGTVCSGNVDAIPADAHFLVAMYAPRGFTTLDNNRIGHLGPVAQYTAAAAGAEVFKALGVESHVGYHGGNDGDPHGHCSFNASQEDTARKAIRGFLTKTEAPANFMEPKLKNQSNQDVDWSLEQYVEWTAPTLN